MSKVVGHRLEAKYNSYINSRKLEIDKRLLELTESRAILKMSNKQLKEYLLQDDTTPQAYRFIEHYNLYVGAKTKAGTLDTYKNTYANMAKFCDIETLSFEQMDYAWVRDFDKFLEDRGVSINGRGVYLRNIRTLFNDAIKCDYVELGAYPFRKFKIKTEKTRKRSLTVEQLQLLRDYPVQQYQERYRDIFMLIFYLQGINLKDLLYLTEIRNGRIEYARAKTGRLYSVKVEPEAIAIIEKYRGKNYLLDIMDSYGDHKDFMRRLNRGLQLIGEMEWVANSAKEERFVKKNKKSVTPIFKELTSYWARHTVATVAANIGITKDTIAAMLGHSNSTVTDVYIDFDLKLIDAAMRQVIDYVRTYKATDSAEE